jgi:hypothetical protein
MSVEGGTAQLMALPVKDSQRDLLVLWTQAHLEVSLMSLYLYRPRRCFYIRPHASHDGECEEVVCIGAGAAIDTIAPAILPE